MSNQITGEMVQVYVREYISYIRTQVDEIEKEYESAAYHVLDLLEDAVEDAVDMLEMITKQNIKKDIKT